MRTLLAFLLAAIPLSAAAAADPPLAIKKASGAITIDGDLNDPGWKDALRFDTWYETNPGDSVEPKVKTVGWITYDEHFFYAAIDCYDPNPSQIRSQLGDHDNINGNSDDFGHGFLTQPRTYQGTRGTHGCTRGTLCRLRGGVDGGEDGPPEAQGTLCRHVPVALPGAHLGHRSL